MPRERTTPAPRKGRQQGQGGLPKTTTTQAKVNAGRSRTLKRGYGEGSIRQLPNGKFEGTLYLGEVNGKQVRKFCTRATEREVADQLQAWRVQYRGAGLAALPTTYTVEEYLRLWLSQAIDNKRTATTAADYRSTLERHVYPALGKVPLTSAAPLPIQMLLTELEKNNKRVPSKVFAILHAAFGQAVKWELLKKSPMDGVERPRYRLPELEPLTEEQARWLFEHLTGHRLEALYRLALCLGLRKGEATALLRSDINLATREVRIRRASAKTTRSAAVLPLPEEMVPILQAHFEQIDREKAERLAQGLRWKEHGLAFPSTVGTPLSHRNVTRQFQALIKAMNRAEAQAAAREGRAPRVFPHTRFHDLRHACATFLLASGADIRVVQEILRHTTIMSTTRYAHVTMDVKRRAVAAMGGIASIRRRAG